MSRRTSQTTRAAPDALESGPLVHLRRPTLEDREEWVALREESLDHLLPWEPRLKVKSERERWEKFFSTSDVEDRRRFLICRNEDGRMVGYVGLNDIRLGVMLSCNAGYWIAKPYTRKGYMTEGLLLAIRHAFQTLKLHRVEAGIQPHNIASIGVAKKAGMRYEGTSLRYLQIDGKWCDHERWAITIEEWSDPFRPVKSPIGGKPSPRE